MNLRYVTDKNAVLVFTPINRRYITGFNSSHGYLLLTNDENLLFVDGRYYEAATKNANNASVVLINDIYVQINSVLKEKNIQKLLIEVENDISFLNTLKKKLEVKVVPSESLSSRLIQLRSIKSKFEVESIISAQRIAEKAFLDLLNFIKTGVTEREIAAFLEYRMKIHGSEGAAFDTIAVSGPNTSMPHGVPTDRPVSNGDFITLDFGAKINGYCSDMTRTLAVGYATDKMQKVYETVLAAQSSVEENVKAGILCSKADSFARNVISNAGYGEFFTHSTGHGIGMEVHEIPVLSPKNSAVTLRAGQIVSNEPGIYFPKKFGVRIEDMLLITKSGCKNLTKTEKHLIIL